MVLKSNQLQNQNKEKGPSKGPFLIDMQKVLNFENQKVKGLLIHKDNIYLKPRL